MAASRNPRAALVASTTAFTLAILGSMVVNVALPGIRDDLGGGIRGLQWVANGYNLTLATLLLSMGALCDQRGARRVMLAGLGLFATGGAVATVAPSLGVLVAAQLTLGAGAAALIPASLALVTHAYTESRGRARAVAVISAATGVATAAGPVLGGVLIGAVGWRGVFAFDVPAALVVGVMVLRLRETSSRRSSGVDLAGQALAIAALGALTFTLIESGSAGWTSARTLGAGAVAVLAAGAFIAVERRGATPMLPLGLFRARTFSVASASGLLVNFAVYGQLFVFSLYLQEVRGLSALGTAWVFAAMPLASGLLALPSGRITERRGPRLPATVGSLVNLSGAVVLLTVSETSPLVVVALGLALLGAGGGLAIPALTAAVLTDSPRGQVGVAAATFTVGRQTGGLLGVAVLGTMIGGSDFVGGLHASVFVSGAAAGLSAVACAVFLVSPPRSRTPSAAGYPPPSASARRS